MKIFTFIAILLLSFNARAITVNYRSDSSLVSKEELFQIIDKNLTNPRISKLGAEYRLFAIVSTKVGTDGVSLFYVQIELQKNVTDKKTGKKYWVNLEDRLVYGRAETKAYIVEQLVDVVLNHVNAWTPND